MNISNKKNFNIYVVNEESEPVKPETISNTYDNSYFNSRKHFSEKTQKQQNTQNSSFTKKFGTPNPLGNFEYSSDDHADGKRASLIEKSQNLKNSNYIS